MPDSSTSQPENVSRYAGLFRRLFAIFYDGFLLLAVLFIISGIATALNDGKAIDTSNAFYPVYVTTIFGLSYLYFAWFWIHGGQSLGMKTWHIKLVSTEGAVIGWKTTAIRYIVAIFSWGIFMLGFLWAIVDRKKRCWHDLASGTALLDLR